MIVIYGRKENKLTMWKSQWDVVKVLMDSENSKNIDKDVTINTLRKTIDDIFALIGVI